MTRHGNPRPRKPSLYGSANAKGFRYGCATTSASEGGFFRSLDQPRGDAPGARVSSLLVMIEGLRPGGLIVRAMGRGSPGVRRPATPIAPAGELGRHAGRFVGLRR